MLTHVWIPSGPFLKTSTSEDEHGLDRHARLGVVGGLVDLVELVGGDELLQRELARLDLRRKEQVTNESQKAARIPVLPMREAVRVVLG